VIKKIKHYDINTVDSITKFVVEEEFMRSRTRKKIDEYFKRIKLNIYDQLLEKYLKYKNKNLFVFVSDKFENYGHSATKYFYRVCKIVSGVPIACKKYGLKHNNNAIERYNQNINDRYKTMRKMNSFSNAKATFKMRQIIHNFVNPHMELNGKTPAEAAGIKFDLGRNKLLNLIELTAKLKNFGDDVN